MNRSGYGGGGGRVCKQFCRFTIRSSDRYVTVTYRTKLPQIRSNLNTILWTPTSTRNSRFNHDHPSYRDHPPLFRNRFVRGRRPRETHTTTSTTSVLNQNWTTKPTKISRFFSHSTFVYTLSIRDWSFTRSVCRSRTCNKRTSFQAPNFHLLPNVCTDPLSLTRYIGFHQVNKILVENNHK